MHEKKNETPALMQSLLLSCASKKRGGEFICKNSQIPKKIVHSPRGWGGMKAGRGWGEGMKAGRGWGEKI